MALFTPGVFVVFVGFGALLVTRDGAVRTIGRALDAVLRWLPVGPRIEDRRMLGEHLLCLDARIARALRSFAPLWFR